jgi:hypothetical protein
VVDPTWGDVERALIALALLALLYPATIAIYAKAARVVNAIRCAAPSASVTVSGPTIKPLVKSRMIRGQHYFQHLRPIIVSGALMVDYLIRCQWAPQVLFHHDAVLSTKRPIRHAHIYVSVTAYIAATAPHRARMRTIFPIATPNLSRPSQKGFTTRHALALDFMGCVFTRPRTELPAPRLDPVGLNTECASTFETGTLNAHRTVLSFGAMPRAVAAVPRFSRALIIPDCPIQTRKTEGLA